MGMRKKFIAWLKWRPPSSSIPNWAWLITWSIMLAAIIADIICIVGLLRRYDTMNPW